MSSCSRSPLTKPRSQLKQPGLLETEDSHSAPLATPEPAASQPPAKPPARPHLSTSRLCHLGSPHNHPSPSPGRIQQAWVVPGPRGVQPGPHSALRATLACLGN